MSRARDFISIFVFLNKTKNDVSHDTSIIIIDEDKERFKNDFRPDEEIMKTLFKFLLDCHPNYSATDNDSDDDDNMSIASLKKIIK